MTIMGGGTIQKSEATKFLDEILEILKNKNNTPHSKVMAMHVIKTLSRLSNK